MNTQKIVDHDPAKFGVGSKAKVDVRFPIGHYRVPFYLRGKTVEVIRVLGRYINPEEEAFGKNAGGKMWYYLVCIPQNQIWPDYSGPEHDRLEIEVFEAWLDEIQ
ncbi:SH3-like domain-containing protein [Pedobacter panaciterrae]|uniref:SH3-like domain-containing protein n=1 Tax=Pedobacter panaciterrae TaxID=363849 RepID=UPI002594C9BB|nr:SH3-like domain-containing protein [uncultured Pedobacter sp.]